MNDSDSDTAARTEEFVRLLGETQKYRFGYLMSLLQDRDLVDEVLQETNLVLWREFANFQSGTNFTAWSCRVAFNQVRTWRANQRRTRLRFSDEFLEAVAIELDEQSEFYDQRIAALRGCISELPDHHRHLVQVRYTSDSSIEGIAEQTDKTVDSVYRMLSRVRQALRVCVGEKMSGNTV